MLLVRHSETNGFTQFFYLAADKRLSLSIESAEGDKPRCDAVFNNLLGYLNSLIATNHGKFVEITPTEMNVELVSSNSVQKVFAFILPNSVNIWTYSLAPIVQEQGIPKFEKFRDLSNRQRYEQAMPAGNISMGHWRKSIHDYATELRTTGKKEDALNVLKNLLSTSPFDYEAHLEFMENTADSVAASNSAKIVLKSAENADQIGVAAKFLGVTPKTIESVSRLETNETGLQLILIPITPCNPWLLEEAAKIYQQITGVPVKIRRLNEEWLWGEPERIARQRDIQGILMKLKQQNIDFKEWTKKQYIEALSDAVKSQDALSKYWGQNFVEKINTEPGQSFLDPYVTRFCETLKKYRSKDVRTMYVAITETNIYSGDNNYVFSLAKMDPESPASVMSYYMMLGKTLGQEYDSRQRLVERIAKELVPASLKQLGIPRSTDPTCPYSYSSGIERLDQKTLTLSDDVKQALNKLKNPTK